MDHASSTTCVIAIAFLGNITAYVYIGVSRGMKPLQAMDAIAGRLFDLRWKGYSSADVFATLEAYGQASRDQYRRVLLGHDLWYAPSYGSTWFMVLWCLGLWVPWLRWASILPIMAATFDTAENVGLAEVCAQHPSPMRRRVRWSSRFTTAKWMCIAAGSIVTVAGLITVLVAKP
jgi:hypothetical protein